VERLGLEAAGWGFQPESVLDGIDVQPGWTCLDVGCGPGGMLVPLSRRAGTDGFVVGVDVDVQHLAEARALVRQAQLANVEILKRDIFDTGLPREAFDFVHARLGNASAGRHAELLDELLALTRPGGVVALQCVAWVDGSRGRSIEIWGYKRRPSLRN
jgi:ubiquinone/menaquinone biosynthesis C-methylase UbiE